MKNEINKHLEVLHKSVDIMSVKIPKIAKNIESTISKGNKIILCGNGGSASDSIHFSAELAGKFRIKKRRPLPCISISENISTISAIGNDFSFDEVFSRQVEAIGKKNDLLIGITTSGKSKNIIKAFEKATKIGINKICFCGSNINEIKNKADIYLNIQSDDTARVQELHILSIHIICDIIDKAFSKKK